MKCVHCSFPLTGTDWFCPNCRRGIRRSRRPGRSWAPLAAVLTGAALGAAALSLRPQPAPRLAAEPETRVSIRTVAPPAVDGGAPGLESVEAAASAAAEVRPSRPRLEADRHRSDPGGRPHSPQPAPDADGVGAVTVTTDSEIETFVYLNGGSLLGRAPLRGAAIPAGRQTLVFWSPSVGGRSTRRINMRAGQTLTLTHRVAPRDRFAPLEGG